MNGGRVKKAYATGRSIALMFFLLLISFVVSTVFSNKNKKCEPSEVFVNVASTCQPTGNPSDPCFGHCWGYKIRQDVCMSIQDPNSRCSLSSIPRFPKLWSAPCVWDTSAGCVCGTFAPTGTSWGQEVEDRICLPSK
jgi:hypothetical protein